MASRTITMQKIREIIRLLEGNINERQIARAVQKSRTAVRRVKERMFISQITWEQIRNITDDELKELIYPSGNNKELSKADILKQHLPEYLKKLNKKHENKLHLWEEYKKLYPDGLQYSQFCHYLLQHIRTNDVSLPLHHEYGDMLFVDFAGDCLLYNDGFSGKQVEAQVFIAVLPASQYTFAVCTTDQKMENWITSNEKALQYFGGVPNAIVPDCCKTAVTKAHMFESTKNPQYVQFSEHYDTVIFPARPVHPKDKALVENTVNNIYRYIYPRINERTYYSLEELNERLGELLEKYNNRIMRAYDCSRKELFDTYEKRQLKSLPEYQYEYKNHQSPRSTSYGMYIYFKEDKHYYSIPTKFRKEKCSIFYNNRQIEICCNNKRIASHNREKGKNQFTTNKNHLPERYRQYLKWTPERLTNWSKSIGKYTFQVITSILKKAKFPPEGVRSSLYIMSLSSRYSAHRLERACERALSFGSLNGTRIENILKKNLDYKSKEQQVFDEILPIHQNIRYTTKKDNTNDRTNKTKNEGNEIVRYA
jgi:transposase